MSLPVKKNYTEKELAFLDALFTPEVNGDIRLAMDVAGYSKNTRVKEVMSALRSEILEASELMVAVHAPKALLGVIASIDNPNTLGAGVKLKAAQDLLDRAGVTKKDANVNLKIPVGGIVILPPKNNRIQDITPDESDFIDHDEFEGQMDE